MIGHDDWSRRTFITASATGAAIALAGCSSGDGGDDDGGDDQSGTGDDGSADDGEDADDGTDEGGTDEDDEQTDGADEQSGDLSYGATVSGEITNDSPSDPEYGDLAEPFTFQGNADDVVEISMTSDEIDTYLLLTGPDGELVGENDDAQGTNSTLIRGLPQDGTYTVWAGSFFGTTTGPFTLSLSRGDQSALVPPEASDISLGDTVEGELTLDSPLDPYFRDPGVPYTFTGTAGMTITVSMESQDISPYVLVTDRYGRLVEGDDETGLSADGELTATLPADGTYVLWAESNLGEESGQFTLSLTGDTQQ